MKKQTLLAIGLVFLLIILGACHRTPQSAGPTASSATSPVQAPVQSAPTTSSATPPPSAPTTSCACIANITVAGSFINGRTFETFQDFPDVTKEAAFSQLLTTFQANGMRIRTQDPLRGAIISWKGNEQLSAVVRNIKPAGIRVQLTYLSPGGMIVSDARLYYSFCKIMEDVQSASTEP